MKRLLALALMLPFPLAHAAEPIGKEAVPWQGLAQRLEAIARSVDGVVAFSLRDERTGALIEQHADEVFPTASTIKVAVLYELYRQADAGRIDLAQVIQPPTPRLRGGGVLQELGPDVRLTWRDLPGRPYTIGIMSGYLREDAEGDRVIREISAAAFQTLDRLARSSPYGRIVSER